MTLRELTSQYQELMDMATDPDMDPDMVADTMEAVEGEIEDKADAYAVILARLEADAGMVAEEIKRLQAWKKRLEENGKRMKDSLLRAMRATGKEKFKTAYHAYSIRKNPPALVVDANWQYIPAHYLIYKEPEIDRAAIKKALTAGADLGGIAHLEQSEGVRIS